MFTKEIKEEGIRKVEEKKQYIDEEMRGEEGRLSIKFLEKNKGWYGKKVEERNACKKEAR